MISPSFQFYAADYLADENVQLMSLEEEGAYIRLLSFCWREGSIPADISKLQMLCKGASEMVIRVVTKCFKQHPENGERLVHPRLEEEREKQKKWKQKSSEGGKKSAAKRWGSERKEGNKGGYEMVEPNCNSSTSISTSIIPPIVPQGGHGEEGKKKESKSSRLPTSEPAIRISNLYRRRLSTPWGDKEIRAFRKLQPMDMDDLALVEEYVKAQMDRGDDGKHRRDLATFLNNYLGELDRARAWKRNQSETVVPFRTDDKINSLAGVRIL